jgi:hypothetical protein
LVSPVTVADVALAPALTLKAPDDEVTVYEVIAEPPLEAGAVHVTVAWALPGVAATFVGAPEIVAGVTEFDAADAGLLPAELVAITVKV